jgi:hypothetical protein
MLLGLVMLTASWGTNLQGWVICYAVSLFVYGEFTCIWVSEAELGPDMNAPFRIGSRR